MSETEVNQGNIGLGIPCVVQVERTVGAGNNGEVFSLAEERGYSLPQDGIVLDNEQSEFSHRRPHELDL